MFLQKVRRVKKTQRKSSFRKVEWEEGGGWRGEIGVGGNAKRRSTSGRATAAPLTPRTTTPPPPKTALATDPRGSDDDRAGLEGRDLRDLVVREVEGEDVEVRLEVGGV